MAGAVVARPWATLSVTGDQASWNYNFELPAQGCAVRRSVEPFAGGLSITFAPAGCKESTRSVFVAGDSHAGAYSALLRKLVSETGIRVAMFSKPGCPVFGLRRPVGHESPECTAFVDAVLRQLSNTVRPNDLLFLPGLRVPRFVDYAGQIAKSVKVTEEERAAASDEAQQRLVPIAKRGAVVVFEAPKPVFKSPPFRCGDWFNSMNVSCVPGMSIDRAELEQLRRPALSAIERVVSGLPGALIFDPSVRLCNQQRCEAIQGGKPVFFDADHLSGFGNVLLYEDFARLVH
jgi:hypothetical protein